MPSTQTTRPRARRASPKSGHPDLSGLISVTVQQSPFAAGLHAQIDAQRAKQNARGTRTELVVGDLPKR